MNGQRFLKHLKPINAPVFATGSVFMLRHTIHTQSGSLDSALVFTSCLYRAWRSARGDSLGPSQVFWACTRPYICAWLSGFPQIHWRLSKPQCTSSPSAFPVKLFSLLFVPVVIHHLRQLWLKHLPVNGFDKWLHIEAFSARLALVRSKKISLWMGSSREPPDRSNNYSSFRTRLWRAPALLCSLWYQKCGLLFSRLPLS